MGEHVCVCMCVCVCVCVCVCISWAEERRRGGGSHMGSYPTWVLISGSILGAGFGFGIEGIEERKL
jgi:hypothetical protein